jgi:hypothetical protein
VVTRWLWCDAATADYARAALNFPGLRVVLRVDCATRPAAGAATVETRYFASSLDPARTSPERLLELVRGHWQVENCLHFEKDRWWDEDRHMCRRLGLAERFTTLMSAAVTVLRVAHPGEPGEPLKAQADALNWDIGCAINLITGSHL